MNAVAQLQRGEPRQGCVVHLDRRIAGAGPENRFKESIEGERHGPGRRSRPSSPFGPGLGGDGPGR